MTIIFEQFNHHGSHIRNLGIYSYIIYTYMLQQKSKSGKPQKCPDKTRTAHNLLVKCHISAFDQANLVKTNLIWAKP